MPLGIPYGRDGKGGVNPWLIFSAIRRFHNFSLFTFNFSLRFCQRLAARDQRLILRAYVPLCLCYFVPVFLLTGQTPNKISKKMVKNLENLTKNGVLPENCSRRKSVKKPRFRGNIAEN
jgi:hypothetical protein